MIEAGSGIDPMGGKRVDVYISRKQPKSEKGDHEIMWTVPEHQTDQYHRDGGVDRAQHPQDIADASWGQAAPREVQSVVEIAPSQGRVVGRAVLPA